MDVIGVDVGGSSVKVSALIDGVWRGARSGRYERPTADGVRVAVGACGAELGIGRAHRVGLSVPGTLHADGSRIERSFNLPELEGVELRGLVAEVLDPDGEVVVVGDGEAQGVGYVSEHPADGVTACVALGTGVGMCVLDGDRVRSGAGHVGQLDVGLGEGMGYVSVEGVLGARGMGTHDPETVTLALVRLIRCVHALWVPARVVLLGGNAGVFADRVDEIKGLVDAGVTALADPGWVLEVGDSVFYASRGAAIVAGSR